MGCVGICGLQGKTAHRRRFTKVFSESRRKRTEQSSCVDYAAVVYRILKKMGSAARREAIQNSMKQNQRLSLEEYMTSLKQKNQIDANCIKKPDNTAVLALCDVECSDPAVLEARHAHGRSGICKSCAGGKMYGYYAKVGIGNLTFWGQIHRELMDAVRDHIILSNILEQIRLNDGDFTTRVRSAVATVLAEEDLDKSRFLRTVTVRFSAQHWIGCGLSVHFSDLERALNAWMRLHDARGATLFVGGHATSAYNPEVAVQQWRLLRQVFIELQTESGRRNGQWVRRSDVEKRLSNLEASYRSTFLKKLAKWRQRKGRISASSNNTASVDRQAALFRRLEQVLQRWEHKRATWKRHQRRLEVWRRKEQLQLSKKRRWDGKESYQDFKRRVCMQ